MFRVYIINVRGIKMYYTGKVLIQEWSASIDKAKSLTFKEACVLKGYSKERYIEEI